MSLKITDLHTHTDRSDGVLTPRKLVEEASRREVEFLAVADHDTIAGVDEALKAGLEEGVNVIPAIEISVKTEQPSGSIHLLGYYPADSEMKLTREYSNSIESSKIEKIKKEIEIANKEFGTTITLEDLKDLTTGVPATVHLARKLVEKGVFQDLKEAMTRFVSDERLKVKGSKKIEVERAIRMIHEDGGKAVLAHPFAYANVGKFKSREELIGLVEELVSKGLDGIEVSTCSQDDEEKAFAEGLCEKHCLLKTAGSDFHDEETLPENVLGSLLMSDKDLWNLMFL